MDIRSDSAVPNFIQRTNTIITAPDGIEDDDLLPLLFEIGASGIPPTPTPPSGFTALTGFPLTRSDSNGFTVNTYAWGKIADGEAGDYTIMHANAFSQAYMLAAPGGDIADPFDPAPTTNTGLGTTATAPGLTTAVDESLIVYWVGRWNWPGITPPGGTTPTLTERESGDSGPLYVATGVLSPAGATGDKVATDLPQAGNEPWASGLIAIKAAGSQPQPKKLRPRRIMTLPATTAIEIPVAELTGGDNKSDLIRLDDASRVTLMVQASANPSAGEWVLRAIAGDDVSVSGQIIATVNFPVTPDPSRVASVTEEVAHVYAYVEQVTPIADATLETVILYKQ